MSSPREGGLWTSPEREPHAAAYMDPPTRVELWGSTSFASAQARAPGGPVGGEVVHDEVDPLPAG